MLSVVEININSLKNWTLDINQLTLNINKRFYLNFLYVDGWFCDLQYLAMRFRVNLVIYLVLSVQLCHSRNIIQFQVIICKTFFFLGGGISV